MLDIAELMGNAPVTAEQYKYISDRVIVAARRPLISRKLTGVSQEYGLGVQHYAYDDLTEISDAILTWAFQTGNEDAINLSRSSANIPILEKKFRIPRRDLESSKRAGTPLNVSNAQSAGYKVGYLENDLVINGWSSDGTNYDINGLKQGAGNAVTGTADYGTAANIVTNVNSAIALLVADNIMPPYNMVLNPTQWTQTGVLISNSAKSYRTWIKEVIGGEIFVTPFMAAASGMILATAGQGHFELIRAQDVRVETWEDPDSKDLKGRVYEACVPVLYDSNAVCTLGTI